MIFALLVSGGCARSPEAKKARHLQRGDTYAEKEKYREAIFEYRSALRYEQTNVRAIRQLGLIHYQLGELAQAYGFLLKAQEMEPDNLDVRLKLGTMYLAGRQREQAREEAAFILQRQPNNLDALILSAGTATMALTGGTSVQCAGMRPSDPSSHARRRASTSRSTGGGTRRATPSRRLGTTPTAAAGRPCAATRRAPR